MLQRLLSCDPQFLSPMTWEMIQPVPAGRPENWRETPRFKEASKVYGRSGVKCQLYGCIQFVEFDRIHIIDNLSNTRYVSSIS